ncbi:MAG: patatin-like phospholipase family protein [Clostridia bacterium]|nr:patatin-like phospholipase family protein [Clostridia bacterium]
MAEKKTLGFALGSGGSRGLAHIGFLQAMEEAGIVPDYISGCSMGAIVGASYSAGMTPAEMKKASVSLRFLDIVSVTGRIGGLLDTHSIRRLLKRYLGEISFDDLKIPFTCVAVDMISQKTVELKEGNLIDAIIASCSIPAIFKPTERDGMRLVDGGVLERVPTRRVKKLGADKVVAVDVIGNKSTKDVCPNAVMMLAEVFDVLDNYRAREMRKKDKKIVDLWLEPDLGDMNQYSFKNLPYAYEQGYKMGIASVDKIKALMD